jgi:hypothetical protein
MDKPGPMIKGERAVFAEVIVIFRQGMGLNLGILAIDFVPRPNLSFFHAGEDRRPAEGERKRFAE